jgi:hypothetical protein
MTKINLRPNIDSIIKSNNQSVSEIFQNDILRPILKLQHDLIICFFHDYALEKKIDFTEINELKAKEIIDGIFNQDNTFKLEIKGIIIGLFTISEYQDYTKLKKELNKRIYGMVKERILSTI